MSKWCSVSTSSNKSPRSQVTEVVPNVRGSSVRKLLHVSLLAHRILMCLLQFWNICKHCDMGQAICMYNIFAVSASYIYKGISKLRIYTHIYRGFCTAFVADICTGMSMHTVLQVSSHMFYRVLQECTDVNRKLVGDAGLGLAPYGLFQSNPGFYSHFDPGYSNIRQPHIFKCQIEGKSLVLYSSNYGMMKFNL